MRDSAAGAASQPTASQRGRQQVLRGHYETLAALLDANTFRHLERLGIAAGWRCWELGAGALTVPAWLAQHVGPAGYVLATDIDVTFLQSAGNPPYEVARHDIGADPAPPEAYDLVHGRLVLEHIPRRHAALHTMTQALRPGGWLLIESADPQLQPLPCPDEAGPAQKLANRILQPCWTLQARRTDLGYGRTLPRRLRSAGLVDVGAEVCFSLAGLLVLLYAQKLTAITALTTQHVQPGDGRTLLRLGSRPIILPAPLNDLVARLAAGRRRPGSSLLEVPSPWLFPGRQPGTALTPDALGLRLHALGISPRLGRSTALLTLAAEVPAAILAKTLAIHVQVAIQWQKISAGDWAAYAADISRRGHAQEPARSADQPADSFPMPERPVPGVLRRPGNG